VRELEMLLRKERGHHKAERDELEVNLQVFYIGNGFLSNYIGNRPELSPATTPLLSNYIVTPCFLGRLQEPPLRREESNSRSWRTLFARLCMLLRWG